MAFVSRVTYLAGPRPRVISHRGNTPGYVENTLPAFSAALAAGADILESDVHVSADGVAVLCHDDSLERLTGDTRHIAEMTWADLKQINLGNGSRVPSLEEALRAFPETPFNLDLKSISSPRAACAVIKRLEAVDRVLLASFSDARRREALRLIPRVLSSASARRFFWIALAAKLGATGIVRLLCRDMCAVQIPTRYSGVVTTEPRFIAVLHRAGLEVHFWVINDPDEMRALLRAGADALITDEVATARSLIDSLEPES